MAQHVRDGATDYGSNGRSSETGGASFFESEAQSVPTISGGFDPSAFGTVQAPQEPQKKKRRGVPAWVFILVAIVAFVGGGLIGRFVLTPNYEYVQGKTSLSEEELESVVGTYVTNGVYHEITARDAIETTSSLDAAKLEDGSYSMPSADSILNAARNAILFDAATAEGIEVTDEDVEAYAQETLGTTDYASLSESYGMTEDQVRQMVRESATIQKLYDQKAKETSPATGTAPEAPTAPEEGQEDKATPEYGAYLVGLLGDNWDSTANSWANTENPYYEVLSDEVFSSDSATYDQAMEAYTVAYDAYTENAGAASTSWLDYVNGLLADASITIGELVS